MEDSPFLPFSGTSTLILSSVLVNAVCLFAATFKHGHDLFLGAFAKFRRVTVSFIMSVCPSVRLHGKLSSHWTDFHEILYLTICQKSVDRIKM
jgi:hypothetical protein